MDVMQEQENVKVFSPYKNNFSSLNSTIELLYILITIWTLLTTLVRQTHPPCLQEGDRLPDPLQPQGGLIVLLNLRIRSVAECTYRQIFQCPFLEAESLSDREETQRHTWRSFHEMDILEL